MKLAKTLAIAALTTALTGFASVAPSWAEWKPTKTIEFIVPAGTGGGADQMARMIQGVIQKHGLSDQSVVVINKSGGAGAEGFMDVKESDGNDHKIIITLSNLFTRLSRQAYPSAGRTSLRSPCWRSTISSCG